MSQSTSKISLIAELPKKYPPVAVALLNLIYLTIILLLSPKQFPLPGDAGTYEAMAQGALVGLPFRNRVLIPWIVSLFPIQVHKWVFLCLTTASLIACSVLLFEYLSLKKTPLKYAYLGVLIWMTTWAFQYYLVNFGVVDPPLLAIMMASLVLMEKNRLSYIAPLLILGFLVKESALLILPLVLLEAIHRREWTAAAILGAAGSILVIVTLLRPSGFSIQSLFNAFAYNRVPLNQGLIVAIFEYVKQIGVYAFWDFGVVLLSAFAGFVLMRTQERLHLLYFVIAAVAMTLIATDWGRELFVVFPVLILAGLTPLRSTHKSLISERADTCALYMLVMAMLVFVPATWLLGIDGNFAVNVVVSCCFAVFAFRYSFGRKTDRQKERLA